MVFTLGLKTLPDIVDEISNSLIASVDSVDGLNHWIDAEPGIWTTADKTGMKARRALKYTNGAEVMYLTFECRNTWYSSWDGHAAKGLRITFSQTWDTVNHTYGATVQQTSIPFEDYSGAQPIVDLATMMLTYYLWVESNGFVTTFKAEPTNSNSQNSVFITVERNPNKEYPDGYSNFYCFNVMNMWPTFARIGYTYGDIHRSFLRPFAYEWPTTTQVSSLLPFWYCLSSGTMERYYAAVATGDKKVYYRKPIVSNNKIEPGAANTAMAPIFNVELWFPWSEMAGLVDGDIIQIEGSTKKYLCKSLDSPDTTSRLTYAMKYSD